MDNLINAYRKARLQGAAASGMRQRSDTHSRSVEAAVAQLRADLDRWCTPEAALWAR